jgi:hypothetical protein
MRIIGAIVQAFGTVAKQRENQHENNTHGAHA